MHFELWRERLAGAAMIAGILLAGLRAQASAEQPAVEAIRTKIVLTDGEKQTETVEEDVLFLTAGEEGESSGPQDVLRAINPQDGNPSLQIEAFPAGNILSVRAEPATSEDAKQKYWIGVQLREVDGALRSHLKLGEGEGLLVAEIFPDSPGEKSGLKSHDIVVAAGEKRITEAANLLAAVEESGGKELYLRVIRAGKEEQVKVTPAERPKPEPTNTRQVENEDVSRWLGELKLDSAAQSLGEALRSPRDAYRYSIVRPSQAIVLSRREPAVLPEGTSITITREGKNPAKISVKRDAGNWEVTEEKLGELPDDVRPLVEGMLGRPQPMPQLARSRRMAAQLAEPPVMAPGVVPTVPATPPRQSLRGHRRPLYCRVRRRSVCDLYRQRSAGPTTRSRSWRTGCRSSRTSCGKNEGPRFSLSGKITPRLADAGAFLRAASRIRAYCAVQQSVAILLETVLGRLYNDAARGPRSARARAQRVDATSI